MMNSTGLRFLFRAFAMDIQNRRLWLRRGTPFANGEPDSGYVAPADVAVLVHDSRIDFHPVFRTETFQVLRREPVTQASRSEVHADPVKPPFFWPVPKLMDFEMWSR